jgi:hypothetical protein
VPRYTTGADRQLHAVGGRVTRGRRRRHRIADTPTALQTRPRRVTQRPRRRAAAWPCCPTAVVCTAARSRAILVAAVRNATSRVTQNQNRAHAFRRGVDTAAAAVVIAAAWPCCPTATSFARPRDPRCGRRRPPRYATTPRYKAALRIARTDGTGRPHHSFAADIIDDGCTDWIEICERLSARPAADAIATARPLDSSIVLCNAAPPIPPTACPVRPSDLRLALPF